MPLKLNQQKIEFIYSVVLVVLIPLSIIGSTLWLTHSVKNNFDLELRRKANLANQVFGVSASRSLADKPNATAASDLQHLIEESRRQAPEIAQLSVIIPKSGTLVTIASSDSNRINEIDTSTQSSLAFSRNESIASLVATAESGGREWLVTTPITDPSGTTIALASMRVSLATSDATIRSMLLRSFIILAIIIIIIVALLLNHFRFVEYAELFRKQKELDQMKDDFISIATHELKTPMSVIKGYLSMAIEEKPPKAVNDMLLIATDQSDRLIRLVGDLLDVSRIEQGRTTYAAIPVDLTLLISPMIETFQIKARAKNLQLTYITGDDAIVLGDPDRISEVMTNLIDNAIKYTLTGTVTVNHLIETDKITTTVSDTGLGMTEDERKNLFQRFYRIRNADTAPIAGTGLGLWIIKQYIEHMNGSIQVESVRGTGSKFIIVLPRFTTTSELKLK